MKPELLPGHVERRMVRCGKPNCKCACGALHGPYHYHITTDAARRTRRYIRRADVESVQQACQAHRELQAELLAGRQYFKMILARAKELLRAGEL